jgi:hypothetical protein
LRGAATDVVAVAEAELKVANAKVEVATIEAMAEVFKAKAKVANAKTDAEKAAAKAEVKVAKAKADVAKAEANGEVTVAKAEAEVAKAEAKVANAKTDAEKAAAKAEVKVAKAKVEVAEADAEAKVKVAKAEANGEVNIAKAKAEVAKAKVKVASAKTDAEAVVAKAEVKVAEAKVEVAKAEARVRRLEKQCNDAQCDPIIELLQRAQTELTAAETNLDAAETNLATTKQPAQAQERSLQDFELSQHFANKLQTETPVSDEQWCRWLAGAKLMFHQSDDLPPENPLFRPAIAVVKHAQNEADHVAELGQVTECVDKLLEQVKHCDGTPAKVSQLLTDIYTQLLQTSGIDKEERRQLELLENAVRAVRDYKQADQNKFESFAIWKLWMPLCVAHFDDMNGFDDNEPNDEAMCERVNVRVKSVVKVNQRTTMAFEAKPLTCNDDVKYDDTYKLALMARDDLTTGTFVSFWCVFFFFFFVVH